MALLDHQLNLRKLFKRRSGGRDDAFYRRLIAAAASAALALVLLAGVILFLVIRDFKAGAERARMIVVLREMAWLENDLATMEQWRRTALLTGQAVHADNFVRAQDLAGLRLKRLRSLMTPATRGAQRLDTIDAALAAWVASVRLGINAVRAGQSGPDPQAAARPAAKEYEQTRRLLEEGRAEMRLALAREPGGVSEQSLFSTPCLDTLCTGMANALWQYLAGGDEQALKRFEEEVRAFETFAAHLRVLLSDSPSLRTGLATVQEAAGRWLRDAARPAIGARQQTGGVAAALARLEQQADTLHHLRRAIASFDEAQVDAFERINTRARVYFVLKIVAMALFCLLALAVLIGASWYSFRAYTSQLRQVEAMDAQTRAVINATLDGIITLNDQGVIQMMNPAAEKIFGVKAADVVGDGIGRLIPERLLLQDMARLGRGTLTATGQRNGYYPFPVEISLSEMPVGRSRHFVAVVRDVTERKRAEELLQDVGAGISSATGKDSLRVLVRQLSQAIQSDMAFLVEFQQGGTKEPSTVTIAEGGQIRTVQRYPIEETVFEEVLRKGSLLRLSGIAAEFPGDRLMRELGVEGMMATVLSDQAGNHAGLMGILHRRPLDATATTEATLRIFATRAAAEIERRRFAEDLASEKERLAITLRAMADGFIATDNDGRIQIVNPVAEKLTGWTHEEALGKPLIEVFRIINERTHNVAQNAVQRIIETGSVSGLSGRLTLAARDGVLRLIDANASPIRDRTNRKRGLVLVFRDVTAHERLAEEHRKAEKLEALGVAVGGIAHDFNNLLTAILGNISLAMMQLDAGDEAVERLAGAKRASLRAQELAQRLLTFARGGAPVRETASVVGLIADAARGSLSSSRVRLELDLPDSLWPCEIDSSQISQVIANLTVNAEHAMPDGGVLRITGENVFLDDDAAETLPLRPGRYVKLSISDEGIGIPDEYLKKIFDPYFTTKPQASGLGLATAYSIIKNHHGFLTVESQVGKGSTFFIYLPASENEVPLEKPQIPVAAYKPGATPPQGKGRIMVIDDEEVICQLVRHTLEPLGYEVRDFQDAATAILEYETALKEGRRFDAVITDLTMPSGMSGQDAVKRLREIDPTVKAIVSSGYATDPVMSRYREYGFCAAVAKPYDVAVLGQAVARVLSTSNENEVFHDFVESEIT